MNEDTQFEILINVMRAQALIRNAEGWIKSDPVMAGWLADATTALQKVVDDCTEENQRLAGGMVNG